MSRSFYDPDQNDFIFEITDNLVMNSKGEMIMIVSDKLMMNMETGETIMIPPFFTDYNEED